MSLPEFFQEWYVPAILEKSGRPTAAATVERRGDAVKVWGQLMASPARPQGPLLDEITKDTLTEFLLALQKHSYSRGGPRKYPYSPATVETLLREIQNVLRSCGPESSASRLRANLVRTTPSFYLERPITNPPRLWTLDEAKRIAGSIEQLPMPQTPKMKAIGVAKFRTLMRATIALWAYTGCRNRMVETLTRTAVTEVAPGQHTLSYREQKTGKPRCVPVHPRLAIELEACKNYFQQSPLLIPWPVSYGAVADYHGDLVHNAAIPAAAKNPPKYWRKWFSRELQRTGIQSIQALAQNALDHSSPQITALHYSDAADLLIPQIPDIFAP
jgi:integrase